MGTMQSPTMDDKINKKITAEVIEDSRGKRTARPLQDRAYQLRRRIST